MATPGRGGVGWMDGFVRPQDQVFGHGTMAGRATSGRLSTVNQGEARFFMAIWVWINTY